MPNDIIPFDQLVDLDNPVFKAAGVSSTPKPAEPAAIPFDQIEAAPAETIDASQISHVDDFHRRNASDLHQDDKFDPRQYFADNPDVAKDPAQLQKLLDVYRSRRERGVTLGAVGEGVKAAPGTAVKFAKGLGMLANNVFEFSGLQPLFNKAASVVTGDAFDKQKSEALDKESENRARQAYSEFQAATELSATGLSDLGRTGARKVFGKSIKDTTDQELLAQLSEDAAFQSQLREVQSGRGESLKAAGLDADTLAKDGIQLDSAAIEHLSLVDPATVIATAGLFKVVGTGGKILATAATEAGAAKAATALNNLATQAAGKTVQAAGRGVTAAGEGAAKLAGAVPEAAAEAVGAGAGLANSGTVSGAYVGAKAARGIQAGLVKAGQGAARVGEGITNLGEQITGQIPVSAGVQKLSNFVGTYGRPVTGAVKGAAIGTAAAAPLALLADDDQTAGGILSGGISLGGIAGATHGTFGAVTDAASNKYFGAHEKLLPAVNSPAYGIEPALDVAHQAAIQAVPVRERNLVNNFREGTRNLGGEFYMVNEAEYTKGVAEAYKRETGKDITPELLKKYADTHAQFSEYRPDAQGNVRKVVLLNADAKGLLHDAGHLFDASLTPEVAESLRQAVRDTFTPEQLADAQARYERRLGTKLTPERGMDEFIAEQFNALFHNVPLNEMTAPQSLISKFTDTIAKGAEALGVDLARGKTTPSLNNPLSVGLRELFKNAASEITKANESATPAPTTPPSGPAGPTSGPGPTPTAPATPPVNPTPGSVVPSGPAAPVTPAPVAPNPAAPRNIRVTKAQQDAFAKRAAETGVTEAKANATEPETRARVNEISDSMAAGNPVLEIEHLGIKNEGSAAAPTGRTVRRAEQAKGYADLEEIRADNRANAPESIVNTHQKTFVPVRFTNQGGTPTLIAMSLDKVISNIHKIVSDAADKNSSRLIPYESENGKLTEAGWNKAIADAQAYAENQHNGFRGDGQQLVRPTEDLGFSIPAENVDYTPQLLAAPEANFQNLIQGLATPETAREQKGLTPGNIKGQVLAEGNKRTLLTPAQIKPKNVTKQDFKSFPGRSVKEVNPLRNELAAAGVDVRDLIEVTERIRAKDVASVKPRPDINFKAPVTDIIRGGFLPKEGQSAQDFASEILKDAPEAWNARTATMPGGLTAGAFRFGNGLKNASDVAVLRAAAEEAGKQSIEARATKDLDAIFSAGFKKQFFNEALEAATGSSPGKREAIGRTLGADWKPPFPEGESTSKFLPGEQTDDARRAGLIPDKAPPRTPSKPIQDIAASYAKSAGIDYAPDSTYAPVDPKLGRKLADFYDAAKSDPTDPTVKASYDALIDQTQAQAKQILDAGYTVEPYQGDGEPYKSSADMVADVRDNKHLYFLQTDKEFTGGTATSNPMLAESTVVPGQRVNDVFCWVHDFFGHAKDGYQFGPRGEFNAWRSHSEMYSPEAQGALAAETLAQNSWVNYGKHLDGKDVPQTERPFAEQKNVVVPPELIDDAKAVGEVKFLPRTDAGKKLAEEGFDFRVSGQPGTRAITVLKDGVAVGEFQSAQRTPNVAEISNVLLDKKFRGTGAAEAAYRELLTQLKEDGAKKVEGTVVAPEPLALRRKIFGGFDKLELNGEPVSIADAIQAANEIKTSRAREITNIEAVNDITPESQFLPKKKGDEKKGADKKKAQFPDYVLPATQNGGLENLVDKNGVTEQFWVNSKTGKVILAPDGHEEAAGTTVFKNEPAIREAGDSAVYDAMYARGWIRGVLEPDDAAQPAIHLNGAAGMSLGSSARRTMEDIAFKLDRPVLLNDRQLDLGPVQGSDATESLFLPKKTKRDDEGRPLTKGGLIDYERLYKEKIAAEKKQQQQDEAGPIKNYDIPNNQTELSAKGLTGWGLPNKKFVPLDTEYHQQFLAENADKLNKEFGTTFSPEADVEARLDALNAGFTRYRYEANKGALHIETAAKNWAANRKQILDRILQASDSIDNLIVNLLDAQGKVVDSISEKLFNVDGPEKLNKIEEALDSLRARGPRFLPKERRGLPKDTPEDVRIRNLPLRLPKSLARKPYFRIVNLTDPQKEDK